MGLCTSTPATTCGLARSDVLDLGLTYMQVLAIASQFNTRFTNHSALYSNVFTFFRAFFVDPLVRGCSRLVVARLRSVATLCMMTFRDLPLKTLLTVTSTSSHRHALCLGASGGACALLSSAVSQDGSGRDADRG